MPLLILLSLGTFVVGMGAFGVIGVITPMSRDLVLTPVGASWMMGAYAVAYALGSPLATSLTGRWDRRTVLATGMILFGIGSLACAFATGATTLYGGRILMALGSGLYSPAAAGVGLFSVAPEKRGRALATVYAGLTVAQVLGVPAGAYIGYTIGWMWVFVTVALAAFALTVALVLRAPGRIGIAPATLTDLVGTLTDIRLAVAILLTVTVMSSAWAPYTFLAPMIEEKTGAGPGTVGLLLVIYGLGSVAGNALGGFLTDRVGAVKALAVATAGPLPFMAALTGMAWDPWLGAALLFGWSAVGWAVAVPQQTRLVSLDPARTQVLLALNAASIYLGAAIGSSVGGFAKSLGGIPALGVAGVGIGLLALAHLALTVRLGGRKDRGGKDY